MRATLTAFAAGALFGLGLMISGMGDPTRVLGFFDVVGRWDPSLALVMAGGLAASWLGMRLALARGRPLCAERLSLPSALPIDRRLLAGSALFGIGWGLVGFCPGPALVATAGGAGQAALFTLAMLAGMLASRFAFGGQPLKDTAPCAETS